MLGLANKHYLTFLDEAAVEKATKDKEKGLVQKLRMQAGRDAKKAAMDFLQAKELNDLTEADLAAAKRYWINRPISAKFNRKISVTYASNIVHQMITFFEFCESKLDWQAPRHWDKEMRFARNQKRNMQSKAELSIAKAQKDHMTHDDVLRYFKMGTARGKVVQALAFWCGWTQVELATFRTEEMYVEKGETYIDKCRSKNGAWGKWWIPEPVAKIVRDEIAAQQDRIAKAEKKIAEQTNEKKNLNPDGLAFLTENFLPLIHGGDRKNPELQKTDLIGGYIWPPIQREAQKEGRSHTFKWFRKSSAQRIQDITKNQHVAKAFLAQKLGDVSEKYTNDLVDESIDAAKKLWEGMKDIYDPKKDASAATAAA